MKAYYHSCAYRFDNGEVEGFRGICFEPWIESSTTCKEQARQDAYEQIRRKLKLVRITKPTQSEFDESKIINHRELLTDEEWENVKRDWGSNLRY